jgi:MscS family membrane protein
MDKILSYTQNISEFARDNFLKFAIALSIFTFFLFFSEYFTFFIIKLFNLKEKSKKKIISNGFYKPLKLLFWLLGLYLTIVFLNIPNFINIATKFFRISAVLLITTGIANSIGKSSMFLNHLNRDETDEKNEVIGKFLLRIIKVILYTIATIIIITELGYNISGLITSLGIGRYSICTCSARCSKKSIWWYSNYNR